MAIEKKGEVEIDVRGADRAAAAARTALDPWKRYAQESKAAFADFGREVKSAMSGAAASIRDAVLAPAQFSFSSAIQGAQSFEAVASRVAVASGQKFEETRAKINALSDKLKMSPKEVAGYIAQTGQSLYDFDAAERGLATFSKFAKETGRDLSSTSGLAGAFKRMGVEDADKALRQLRGTAESFRTVGGVAALSDQVAALAPQFGKASNSASQLMALTAALGKGARSPAEAQQIQQAVVGGFEQNAMLAEVHMRRQGMLKPGEHVVDPMTGQIDYTKLQRLQARMRKMPRALAMRRARAWFGGDPRTAAAFLNADLSGIGAPAQELDTDAQLRSEATPGGRDAAVAAERERAENAAGGEGSWIGGARRWVARQSAAHPYLMWGVKGAVTAGTALAAKLGWSALAAKGGGAGAALRGIVPRLAAGGVLAAGALGYAGATAADWAAEAATGTSITDYLGKESIGHRFPGDVGSSELGGGQHAAIMAAMRKGLLPGAGGAGQVGGEGARALERQRAGLARALIRAAHRSGGTEEGFLQQTGAPLLARAGYDPKGNPLPGAQAGAADPVLKSLFEQLRSGAPDLTGLPNDIGQAVARELSSTKALQINVINATGGPIEVEQQPGGEQ